jgi:hypothetical protein
MEESKHSNKWHTRANNAKRFAHAFLVSGHRVREIADEDLSRDEFQGISRPGTRRAVNRGRAHIGANVSRG